MSLQLLSRRGEDSVMLRKHLLQFLVLLEDLPLSEGAKTLVLQVFMQSDLLVEGWSNVPIHCATVAYVGVTLGQAVQLPDADLETIAVAGLLHDARKARERSRADELIGGGMTKGEAYAKAAEEQAEWLAGFGAELAEPVRISALSGHTSLAYFLEQDGRRPVPEQIFHVSDDLCGGQMGDEVVMLSTRIEQLSQRYEWLVTEHPDALGGVSWIEAQQVVATNILEDLAKQTVYGSGAALNAWLVGKFD